MSNVITMAHLPTDINPIERDNLTTELRLVSPYQYPLRTFVETALANELRLLQAGVRRTEQRLHQFETTYNLATPEFIGRFENDELAETLDFAEWIGEYRMWCKLQEKMTLLRGIKIAN